MSRKRKESWSDLLFLPLVFIAPILFYLVYSAVVDDKTAHEDALEFALKNDEGLRSQLSARDLSEIEIVSFEESSSDGDEHHYNVEVEVLTYDKTTNSVVTKTWNLIFVARDSGEPSEFSAYVLGKE